jgi:formate dehydrogenase subunit gamma
MGATTPRSPEASRSPERPGSPKASGPPEPPGLSVPDSRKQTGQAAVVRAATPCLPAVQAADGRGGSGREVAKGRIPRFDRTERLVHWATAALVLALVVTGAILYIPALSLDIGRRLLIEDTHVYIGVAVFVPLLLGLAGRRWGAALRSDLRQMGKLTDTEVAWLRSLGRYGREALGKFNPGQKLNTSAVGGLLLVLFVTGLIMRWGNFLPVGIRTGATFVHDVFAVALFVVIIGHIAFAVAHPSALRSMVAGWVPASWPRRHAPAWTQPAENRPDES